MEPIPIEIPISHLGSAGALIAEEIIKQKDAEIETLIGILKRIVASAPACSCIDAYRLRRLTDPTCARCNGADVDEAIEWLKRVEGGE